MQIYYNEDEGLVIDSKFGRIRVYYDSDRGLIIEGEENLPKLGLTVNDVLAMYFDRTTSRAKSLYPLYRERLNVR